MLSRLVYLPVAQPRLVLSLLVVTLLTAPVCLARRMMARLACRALVMSCAHLPVLVLSCARLPALECGLCP